MSLGKFLLISFVSFVCVFSPFSSSFAFSQENRTWTDSTGTFSVEAQMLSSDGTQVKIKKTDGKVLTLPLSKLSAKDQAYVRSNGNENPFETAEKEAESGIPAQEYSQKPRPVNLSEAREVGDYGDTSWSCEADPAPFRKYENRPKKFGFRIRNLPFAVHINETQMDINRTDGRMLVSAFALAGHHVREEGWKNTTRLCFANLLDGKTFTVDHPMNLYPFGISPDGSKVMFRQGSWELGADWGKLQFLHIVKIGQGKLEPFASYEPFAQLSNKREMHNRGGDIEWASWADDEHVLILSAENVLFLLNVNSGKAIWQLKTSHSPEIALSPGGKYCIVPCGREFLLMDTLSGETIGSLDGTSGQFLKRQFGFSPDGCKIMSLQGDTADLWDATTGAHEEPFYIGAAGMGSGVHWTDNRYVLLDSALIDSELKTPVWTYHRVGKNFVSIGGYCCYLTKRHDEGFLFNAVVLPHAKVKQLDSSLGEDRLFLVRPGMDINLEIDRSINKDREEIERFYMEKLKENGVNVHKGAAVSLTLKVSNEKDATAEYVVGHGFGPVFRRPFEKGTEVTYKPKKYQLYFHKGDKVIWGTYHTTNPPNLTLEDVNKSSLQAAVNEAMSKQHYKDWFLHKTLPKRIPDPSLRGQSMLGDSGIQ